MFLKQQIIILEWFLKDHVALKTGVMMLKIVLPSGINYILKSQIESRYFKLLYYLKILLIYCIFTVINPTLGEHKKI